MKENKEKPNAERPQMCFVLEILGQYLAPCGVSMGQRARADRAFFAAKLVRALANRRATALQARSRH